VTGDGRLYAWDIAAAPKPVWTAPEAGQAFALGQHRAEKFLVLVGPRGVKTFNPKTGKLLVHHPVVNSEESATSPPILAAALAADAGRAALVYRDKKASFVHRDKKFANHHLRQVQVKTGDLLSDWLIDGPPPHLVYLGKGQTQQLLEGQRGPVFKIWDSQG